MKLKLTKSHLVHFTALWLVFVVIGATVTYCSTGVVVGSIVAACINAAVKASAASALAFFFDM